MLNIKMRAVRLEPGSSNKKSFFSNQAAAQLADLEIKYENVTFTFTSKLKIDYFESKCLQQESLAIETSIVISKEKWDGTP